MFLGWKRRRHLASAEPARQPQKGRIMAIFQIDTADLSAKAGTVEATLSRIQSDVSSMEGQLRQLQETWKGSASLAFQDVLTQWRSTQVQVEQSLASVRQAMAMASQQYEDTEQANAQIFGR